MLYNCFEAGGPARGRGEALRFVRVGVDLYRGVFGDYVRGFEAASGFFTHDPYSRGSYMARAEHLRRHFAGDRRTLAESLLEFNRRVGAGPAALERARSLALPEAVAVVAGQQAGLGTGPLLTVYKAASAVATAARLESLLGVPVVPVFWVASEDHDFEEVRWLAGTDSSGALLTLRLPDPPVRGSPVGDVALSREAREVVAGIGHLLEGPHSALVASWLREDAAASSSLVELFCRLMARLFARRGLVLLDPMLPSLKRAAGPVLLQALERGPRLAEACARAGGAVREAGYEPGLDVDPSHACIFRRVNGRRTALLWGDGGLRNRDGTLRWTVDDLRRDLVRDPEDFSPGAVLRPVVQEFLVPTLCTVSGRGEVAYLAQMREVYRLFGLQMPVVRPRLSLTVVEPSDREAMVRYGVRFEALARGRSWGASWTRRAPRRSAPGSGGSGGGSPGDTSGS